VDAMMNKNFPQQFFIPELYPNEIPTISFESDQELLEWISNNSGGYNFINFMYTAIEYSVYNSFESIEICRLITPSAKISMIISNKNYMHGLNKILELGIEGEYYELCSKVHSLIKLLEENKNYFD
jgi:hypothetical protein